MFQIFYQEPPQWIQTYIEENNQIFSWTPSMTKEDLALDYSRLIVAIEDRKIKGYCGWHQVLDQAEITYIFVDPSCRKQGVASRLLQAMVDELTNQSVQSIYLEVRRQNLAARSLYHQACFNVLACRKNYYTNPLDDALVMQLDLVRKGS